MAAVYVTNNKTKYNGLQIMDLGHLWRSVDLLRSTQGNIHRDARLCRGRPCRRHRSKQPAAHPPVESPGTQVGREAILLSRSGVAGLRGGTRLWRRWVDQHLQDHRGVHLPR